MRKSFKHEQSEPQWQSFDQQQQHATYEQPYREPSTLDPSLLGRSSYDPAGTFRQPSWTVQQFQPLPSPWDAIKPSIEGASAAAEKLAEDRLDPVNVAKRQTELDQQQVGQAQLDYIKQHPGLAPFLTTTGPNASISTAATPLPPGGLQNPFAPNPAITTPPPTPDSIRKTDTSHQQQTQTQRPTTPAQAAVQNAIDAKSAAEYDAKAAATVDPNEAYGASSTAGTSAAPQRPTTYIAPFPRPSDPPTAPGATPSVLPNAPSTSTAPVSAPTASSSDGGTPNIASSDTLSLGSGSPSPNTPGMNISGKPIPESPMPVDTQTQLAGKTPPPAHVLDWYQQQIDSRGKEARAEYGPDGQPTGRTVIMHDPKANMADQVIHPAAMAANIGTWTPPDITPSKIKPNASLAAAPPPSEAPPVVNVPSLAQKLKEGQQFTADDLVNSGAAGPLTASSAPGPGPTPVPRVAQPIIQTPSSAAAATQSGSPPVVKPTAAPNGPGISQPIIPINTPGAPSATPQHLPQWGPSSAVVPPTAPAASATPKLTDDQIRAQNDAKLGTATTPISAPTPQVQKALPVDANTLIERANQPSTAVNDDLNNPKDPEGKKFDTHGMNIQDIKSQVVNALSAGSPNMTVGTSGETTLTGKNSTTVPITVKDAQGNPVTNSDGTVRQFTAYVEPVSGKIYTPSGVAPYKEQRDYLDGTHASVENEISKENDQIMMRTAMDQGFAANWDQMSRNDKIAAFKQASAAKNTKVNETFSKTNDHTEAVLDQGSDLLNQINRLGTPNDPTAIGRRGSWNTWLNQQKEGSAGNYPQWEADAIKNTTKAIGNAFGQKDYQGYDPKNPDLQLSKFSSNYQNFMNMVRQEMTPRPASENQGQPNQAALALATAKPTDANFPDILKQYLNTQHAQLSRAVETGVTNQWRMNPSMVVKANQALYGDSVGVTPGGDRDHPIVPNASNWEKIPNSVYVKDPKTGYTYRKGQFNQDDFYDWQKSQSKQ